MSDIAIFGLGSGFLSAATLAALILLREMRARQAAVKAAPASSRKRA